ncbi:MAG: hypothetical protein EA411_09095 [Saprospirales bacterium]|nr:MAG: hypothetical protein EA411_09095 [Saprospirales bacterium]
MRNFPCNITHTSMSGRIPQVISDAIDNHITTPYYLLFGREMDWEGRLKRVWVEVELPHTADFCFWEDGTLSHLKFMTETRANSVKGLSMSKQGAIFDATKQSMTVM